MIVVVCLLCTDFSLLVSRSHHISLRPFDTLSTYFPPHTISADLPAFQHFNTFLRDFHSFILFLLPLSLSLSLFHFTHSYSFFSINIPFSVSFLSFFFTAPRRPWSAQHSYSFPSKSKTQKNLRLVLSSANILILRFVSFFLFLCPTLVFANQ